MRIHYEYTRFTRFISGYSPYISCTYIPTICNIWQYITMHYTTFTLHYTKYPCIMPHNHALHYVTLHDHTLHYIPLHYITSHHTTSHHIHYIWWSISKNWWLGRKCCPPAELVQMPPLRRLRASPGGTTSAPIKALLHVKYIEILYPLIPNQSHVFISALSLASTSSSTTTARLTRSTTAFNVRSLVVNSSIVLADLLGRQTVSAFFI